MMSLRLNLALLAAIVSAAALLQDKPQTNVRPAVPTVDGRYLRAFDVAARHIEGLKDLPLRWRDRENYVVVFKGEKDGNYVFHFLPKSEPPKEIISDHNLKTGLPIRAYVRKRDLKFVDAYIE